MYETESVTSVHNENYTNCVCYSPKIDEAQNITINDNVCDV